MSKGVSEVSGVSERKSEWPSTYISILVCSRPQCTRLHLTYPSFPQFYPEIDLHLSQQFVVENGGQNAQS